MIKSCEIGRNNFALTVFVPYDCPNNCAFCNSKKNYLLSPSNETMVIQRMTALLSNDYIFPIKDVVLTGGEPMANIESLKRILDAIPYKYNVYINTTFINANRKAFIDLVNSNNKICGVNISRHFDSYEKDSKFFKNIAKDEYVAEFVKPVRINCIVTKKLDIDNIYNRWKKYPNVNISFRHNFNIPLTNQQLHNMYDDFLITLSQTDNISYINHTQCAVCDTTQFKKENTIIQYHKSKKHSSFIEYSTITINDLIIFQDGTVAYDWEDSKADIMQFILNEFINRPRHVLSETNDYWEIPTGNCGSAYKSKPKNLIHITTGYLGGCSFGCGASGRHNYNSDNCGAQGYSNACGG